MSDGRSYLNPLEAECAVELVLRAVRSGSVKPEEVGIITPFAAQKVYITRLTPCRPIVLYHSTHAQPDFKKPTNFKTIKQQGIPDPSPTILCVITTPLMETKKRTRENV